jgi:predicted nucleic acid-binding Zn ribbon protein
MKISSDRPIGEVLKELIDTYRLEGKLNEIKVIHSWEKVVGSMIARYTKDVYIKKGKLFVKVDSPALKNELTYNASTILERLNAEVGSQVIEEIVFI